MEQVRMIYFTAIFCLAKMIEFHGKIVYNSYEKVFFDNLEGSCVECQPIRLTTRIRGLLKEGLKEGLKAEKKAKSSGRLKRFWPR